MPYEKYRWKYVIKTLETNGLALADLFTLNFTKPKSLVITSKKNNIASRNSISCQHINTL